MLDNFVATHPSYRLRFLTLTAPPVQLPNLGVQCTRLHDAFTTIYKKLDHAYVGYLRVTDIAPIPRPDFEGPMYARPHIHALMLQKPKNSKTYASKADIGHAWTDAMKSNEPLNVHDQPAHNAFG